MDIVKTTNRHYDQAALDAFEIMIECTGVNGADNMILAYMAGVSNSATTNVRSFYRTGDYWFLDRSRGTEHGLKMYVAYRERMRRLLYDLRAERGYRAR